MKKLGRLFVIGIIAALCVFTFAACGNEEDNMEIDFSVGFNNMDFYLGQNLEGIINTLDEWDILKPDHAMVTEFDKYNEQFFTANSLIVYAFTRGYGGGQVEVAKVSKNENELIVDVIHSDGDMAVVTHGVVIIEVKKTDIIGANSLQIVGKQ